MILPIVITQNQCIYVRQPLPGQFFLQHLQRQVSAILGVSLVVPWAVILRVRVCSTVIEVHTEAQNRPPNATSIIRLFVCTTANPLGVVCAPVCVGLFQVGNMDRRATVRAWVRHGALVSAIVRVQVSADSVSPTLVRATEWALDWRPVKRLSCRPGLHIIIAGIHRGIRGGCLHHLHPHIQRNPWYLFLEHGA